MSRILFAAKHLFVDFVSVHKNAKSELGQYPAILTELAWSIEDLLCDIKSTEKMTFVLVYFRALKRKPDICKSDNAFRFSRFLVPPRQRNHRKSFYCHGKYFAKENFGAPAWTSAKCYCGNKTGNPRRAVSLHLARSGSQLQRGVWFLLPARGASRIIIYYPTVLRRVQIMPIPHALGCGAYWCGRKKERLAGFPFPSPLYFPLFISMMDAYLLGGVGAHGWVVRFYQQSWRWLPMVKAPGCLRHPTST